MVRVISGYGGTMTIGGVSIPIGRWSLRLETTIAILDSRRWEGYLARPFRHRPGMRFADIMRGVGRN